MAPGPLSKREEESSSSKEEVSTLQDRARSSSDCCALDFLVLAFLLLAKDGMVFNG
jgi:hypothetical protein